ncbi:TPA: hypothetical protein OUA79_005368 [Klebsiella variicola]|nr:hypothetical protein [Klebsiella variicola]
MTTVWTWRGYFFGYISHNNLYTYSGRHVGQLIDNDIYGSDGRYLGELMDQNRLITCLQKRNYRVARFSPLNSGAIARHVNYVGSVMYAGYQDFPSPESF